MESNKKKGNIQHIYLYMDDSGKISKYEDYAVFAGIVFKPPNEKSEFVNKYRSIIKSIKCNYCELDKSFCDNECPEVKGINISNADRRRIINLSKHYTTFGTIIYNKNLNGEIVNNISSKGRFSEYAQRRIIKNTINFLINENKLDPLSPIYLHVNIDEMPTKTNGYYSLREGLIEELKYGIINFNYGRQFKPIIYGSLDVQVIYKDSKSDCCIQMADIIANTIRHSFVINGNWNETIKYMRRTLNINVILRLPN